MEAGATFVAPPGPCPYLPDRVSQLHYALAPDMSADDYMDKLLDGWRRFGPVLFRPQCAACQMCQSLRVPVSAFRPSQSQMRAWKKNAGEVTIRIAAPSITDDKLNLLMKFHEYGEDAKGWPADGLPNLRLFVQNPFPTEEWSYFVGDRLIGVGYVDALRDGLSGIYFYWDPAEQHRSPGTFNVLAMIESARERGLPHVYLGYYVEGCRSLEYKARFRPNEILADERWQAFIP